MSRQAPGSGFTGLGISLLWVPVSLLSLLAIASAFARLRDVGTRLAEPAITVVARQSSLVEAAVGKISTLSGVAAVLIPGTSSPLLDRELSDLLGDYNGRTFLLTVTAGTAPAELDRLALGIRALPEVEEVGADPSRRAALLAEQDLAGHGLWLSVALVFLTAACSVAKGVVSWLRETREGRHLLTILGAPPSGVGATLLRRGIAPLLLLWAIPWGFWALLPSVSRLPGPGGIGTLLWFGTGIAALAFGTTVGALIGRRWR